MTIDHPIPTPFNIKKTNIKKQIRDTDRFLSRSNLPENIREDQECKKRNLELALEEQQASLRTKEMIQRYRMVRFFEFKKAQRHYDQALRVYNKDESTLDQLVEARKDLNYVLGFPKNLKYVSLWPSKVLSEEDKKAIFLKREEINQEMMAKANVDSVLDVPFEKKSLLSRPSNPVKGKKSEDLDEASSGDDELDLLNPSDRNKNQNGKDLEDEDSEEEDISEDDEEDEEDDDEEEGSENDDDEDDDEGENDDDEDDDESESENDNGNDEEDDDDDEEDDESENDDDEEEDFTESEEEGDESEEEEEEEESEEESDSDDHSKKRRRK